MMVVEIVDNPNCDHVDTRIFHDLEPPKLVSRVRLEREPGQPRWYEVTGWTVAGSPCPAVVQKVDDSGDGIAFLMHGGDAGLRLQPSGRQAPWRLHDPAQWGVPFLLLTDLRDVRLQHNPERIEQRVRPHVGHLV